MIRVDEPGFLNPTAPLQSLFAATAAESIFSHPRWYDLVVRFASQPGQRPRLYLDGSYRSGLVSLIDRKTGTLASCVSPYSCEFRPLLQSSNTEAVGSLCALIGELAREKDGFCKVLFSGLDPVLPAFRALDSGLRDGGFVTHPYKSWGTWFEEVDGQDFAAFYASRPSILRNTWKRKHAALGKAARMEYRLCGPGADLAEFTRCYGDVYQKSWKQPEPFGSFIPQLIAAAGEMGALRGGILFADDEPIAAQFWLIWNGRATIFKLAYAENWKSHSPGTLLTMRMAEAILAESGIREIDFGRGDDPYKRIWLRQRREYWGIEAATPASLTSWAMSARIRLSSLRDRLRGRGPGLRTDPGK